MKKTKVLGLLTSLMFIAACDSQNATLMNPPHVPQAEAPLPDRPNPNPMLFEKSFPFAESEYTDRQAKFDENMVSVYFQAQSGGESVNNLKKEDLIVNENGTSVEPFHLAADVDKSNEVVDIVFLVDVTGTMVEFIETAKKRLHEFIRTSRERGYHTRMCISTFGDYTVKKCNRFFDNNPKDPSTERQVRELLTELSQLRAFRGAGRDPGWPDLDENPMGALIDASKAPWAPESQRFVIMVTDWGFLSSPDNQGTIGDKAPTMKQINEAIKESQMKVFAITRTEHIHRGEQLIWDGYNTPFQGEPGVVQSSGGEHFNFDKVVRGEITLDSILERILLRVSTNYKLTYIVDQVPGLDITLPVSQRNINIQLVGSHPAAGNARIAKNSILSSMPEGRPQYKSSWQISDQSVQPDSMKVWVNGQEVERNRFSVQGGAVTLDSVPEPNSTLRFRFLYNDIGKNFRLEPISLPQNLEVRRVRVYLNNIEAQPEDIIFQRDLEGQTSLMLNDSILAANDPYQIRARSGLLVRVLTD